MFVHQSWKTTMVALIAASFAVPFAGCSSASDKPASIATDAQVQNIVQMRESFDKAHGDWNAMSAADQEQFNKLAGSPEKAKKAWEAMGKPLGGGAQGPR